MTEEERQLLLKRIEESRKKAVKSKKSALEFLIKAGLIPKNNVSKNLAK